jgi:serine/threonine-protein kinase
MAVKGFRLRVTAGPDQGIDLLVQQPSGQVSIGRSVQLDPTRDLRCTDRKVSRQHATIEASPRGYLLTDHHSANKTRHNGRHVEPEVPVALQDGDELRFGPDTVVRFELVSGPSEPEPVQLEDSDITRRLPDINRPPLSQRGPDRPAPTEPREPRHASPGRGVLHTKAPEVREGGPSERRAVAATTATDKGAPRERFGRFAVYKALSERETDRVDVAVDTRNNVRVALKRFTTRQLSRRAHRRVLDDAERARRWQHPCIAPVLDVGVESGTLYVASQLVDGVPVADLQARYAREIEPWLAAYIIRETCTALQYALRQVSGFVHRNLTPNTILMSASGQVVLINVGFASVKALLDTTVKLAPAEARYLSPEHLRGRGLDPRSDVFSAGIILYELLIQEPIDLQRKAVLPAVDDVRPQVPPAIADVTTRAVSLRPEARFRTPGEMEEELSIALGKMTADPRADAATWMRMRFPDL